MRYHRGTTAPLFTRTGCDCSHGLDCRVGRGFRRAADCCIRVAIGSDTTIGSSRHRAAIPRMADARSGAPVSAAASLEFCARIGREAVMRCGCSKIAASRGVEDVRPCRRAGPQAANRPLHAAGRQPSPQRRRRPGSHDDGRVARRPRCRSCRSDPARADRPALPAAGRLFATRTALRATDVAISCGVRAVISAKDRRFEPAAATRSWRATGLSAWISGRACVIVLSH